MIKNFLIFILLLAAPAVFAEESAGTPDPMEQEPGIPNSAAGILYETTTGTVLFEENADEVRAPASMTKVMTAIIVLEENSFSLLTELHIRKQKEAHL